MTWVTWRQFRTQAWVGAAALATLAVVMLVAWRSVSGLYDDLGVGACTTACDDVVRAFLHDVPRTLGGILTPVGWLALYVLPPVVGAFWGAPLVARELETGTHRLAWTQSVTRTRWLATKVALVGTATAVLAGLLSLVVTRASALLDSARADRLGDPLVFSARGVVPIGYALLGFAAGLAVGVLVRRTLPAMAVTLVVVLAVQGLMPFVVRQHLVPAEHLSVAFETDAVEDLMLDMDGGIRVTADPHLPGAWILSNRVETSEGNTFTGPVDEASCGQGSTAEDCIEWLGTLGLRTVVDYQPADRFWTLQWLETGILLVLTGGLLGVAFWAVRRRLV